MVKYSLDELNNTTVPRVTSTVNKLVKFSSVTGDITDSNLVSNAGGDLGLNMSPSLWHASVRALETLAGSIFQYAGTAFRMCQNVYYSVDSYYKYKTTAPATLYSQENGTHIFSTAPSGTAGTSVTFNEKMKIDNSGNIIVASGSKIQGDFSNATLASRTAVQTNVANSSTQLTILPNGTSDVAGVLVHNASNPTNSQWGQLSATSTAVTITAGSSGTLSGTYIPMVFNTGGAERMRISTNGNVLVTGSGGLGYGTGSGGTVTQLTSKSTAVTLNKPTGQITMNNAALAAGASVGFTLNNSLLMASDTVLVCGQGYGWNYSIEAISLSGGTCTIKVTNITTSTLSEGLVINFAIIKGAIA